MIFVLFIKSIFLIILCCLFALGHQGFDIVGWASGRASDEVLAWLSVWCEVQMICIYGPADATATLSSFA